MLRARPRGTSAIDESENSIAAPLQLLREIVRGCVQRSHAFFESPDMQEGIELLSLIKQPQCTLRLSGKVVKAAERPFT